MIRLAFPSVVVAILVGAGVYGVLVRRNAVLVLIGAELLLAAAGLLLVTGSIGRDGGGVNADTFAHPNQVATIMVITIAAAEIGLALAVILLLYRARATADLTQVTDLGEGSR